MFCIFLLSLPRLTHLFYHIIIAEPKKHKNENFHRRLEPLTCLHSNLMGDSKNDEFASIIALSNYGLALVVGSVYFDGGNGNTISALARMFSLLWSKLVTTQFL